VSYFAKLAIFKETSEWCVRDGAFSLKLLALIDGVFSGLVDTLAGTGRLSPPSSLKATNLMIQKNEDTEETIDTPDGWSFAFEGGAHILFRNTTSDQRYVSPAKHLGKLTFL